MLADRPYMRDQYFDVRYSLTVKVIITLTITFVLQQIAIFYGGAQGLLNQYLALSRDGLAHFRFWQLLTYPLLHLGPFPLHLLFNCISIYYFGRSIEESLGPKRFLMIFLGGIILGGLFQALTTFIPFHPDFFVIGASAGAMALLSAYAALFPTREITTFFYFFPVTLKVQILFWGALLFSIFGTLVPFGNTAQAAHLGGLLCGLYLVRHGFQTTRPVWLDNMSKPAPRTAAFASARKAGSWKAQKVLPVEEAPEDFISKEVDPILDKISAHGIHSLTDHEREVLDKARKKMGRKS